MELKIALKCGTDSCDAEGSMMVGTELLSFKSDDKSLTIEKSGSFTEYKIVLSKIVVYQPGAHRYLKLATGKDLNEIEGSWTYNFNQ